MAIPILSLTQMREWEKATWATGVTEQEVIARVGESIALRLLELTRDGDSLVIVTGKGHNGDDARAARAHLINRKVTVIEALSPNTARETLENLLNDKKACRPRYVVDGIFGVGLNRPLNSEWQQLIRTINDSNVPVFAIDVPSGLNCETGKPEGAAIRAAITFTVGAPKSALLVPSAWEYVGRLETASDVGLVPCPFQSKLKWITAEDFVDFPPPRPVATNKGTFGHIAIIAGSLGYHGASILSSRGAMRARPGLVSLYTMPDVYGPVASQLQATMVHPWKPGQSLPDSCTALIFGPGLASKSLPRDLKGELCYMWQECPLPVIADASALDWLPPGKTAEGFPRVITPHPGEAGRMLKSSAAAIQTDRMKAVRKLSKEFGDCWVVLKGHQTLIGRSIGDIFVNSSGNPFLAQGGSGDVLSGYLAGLLAQPTLEQTIAKTICYAVWKHGHTADRLNQRMENWTIEELLQAL